MDIETDPLFPGWCCVAQMGHREIHGFVTVSTELGVPMLQVAIPGAPGDQNYEPLAPALELVAPGSLYGVRRVTEEAARGRRLSTRPYRAHPLIEGSVPLQIGTAETPRRDAMEDEDDALIGCKGCGGTEAHGLACPADPKNRADETADETADEAPVTTLADDFVWDNYLPF